MANWGGPSRLEVSKYDAHLQEGPEGGLRELQACQSDLGAGKVTEQTILSASTQHAQDNQMIRPSPHGFMKGRSCLTSLISFYEKLALLVDEGKTAHVVYLDFSKAFDMLPHSILVEKLAVHGLEGCTLHWAKTV